MSKIFLIFSVFTVFLFSACPPCKCSEGASPTQTKMYSDALKSTTKSMINPSMDLIEKSLKEVKELQEELNEHLKTLENIEIHNYTIQKEKNFTLDGIKNLSSISADLLSNEAKTLLEQVKNKIHLLSQKNEANNLFFKQ